MNDYLAPMSGGAPESVEQTTVGLFGILILHRDTGTTLGSIPPLPQPAAP